MSFSLYLKMAKNTSTVYLGFEDEPITEKNKIDFMTNKVGGQPVRVLFISNEKIFQNNLVYAKYLTLTNSNNLNLFNECKSLNNMSIELFFLKRFGQTMISQLQYHHVQFVDLNVHWFFKFTHLWNILHFIEHSTFSPAFKPLVRINRRVGYVSVCNN